MDKMGGLEMGRPFFVAALFLLPRFCCRALCDRALCGRALCGRALCGRALVILNLFQDNVPPLVILKQVQDDEAVRRYPETSSG
jgi:hypothetical protein